MRIRVAAAVACLLSLVLGTASVSATQQCGGTDMLAELATNDPAAYVALRKDAEALENTKAVFWRIEKAGASPSFLLGTMHLSDKRITTLSPAVETALKGSAKLVLEVGDLSPDALAAAMINSGTDLVYSDGRSLADHLTPEELAKVASVVAASGMPGDFARLLKPWLVSTLLAVSDCERRQVAQGANVLDMQLADQAKAASIPVAGLETINQQLAALSGIPEDEQLQMLRVSLKYAHRTDDMMETMLQMYLKRDMGAAIPFQLALAKQMGIPASAFDGFQKMLLTDRNVRMSEGAKTALATGNAFIAVGALHLPGKQGLVNLLREAGYTVTPLE